jgi:hypothetical protein
LRRKEEVKRERHFEGGYLEIFILKKQFFEGGAFETKISLQ